MAWPYSYSCDSYYDCQVMGLHQEPVSGLQGEQQRRVTYTLKILNPVKKSKYSVHKIRREHQFKDPEDIRDCIRSECADHVPEDEEFGIGYYKGRGSAKIWIKDKEDVASMYSDHSNSTEISIWCDGIDDSQGIGSKRKATTNKEERPSKRQAIREEVDELFAQLQEKHGSEYTAAQLRLWANMLQVGTHRDTDKPPNVPMFGRHTQSRRTGSSVNDALSSIAEGVMRALKPQASLESAPTTPTTQEKNQGRQLPLDKLGVSPGKCAQLRSGYIEQLKELHKLLELTALTKEEYDEQKAYILSKMQKL